jgi:hypothetical protein
VEGFKKAGNYNLMIVFSNGDWVSVAIPKYTDPCWSKKDLQFYATIYAAASIYDSKRATILAEAAVNKRLYPDLRYDASLEADLQRLF